MKEGLDKEAEALTKRLIEHSKQNPKSYKELGAESDFFKKRTELTKAILIYGKSMVDPSRAETKGTQKPLLEALYKSFSEAKQIEVIVWYDALNDLLMESEDDSDDEKLLEWMLHGVQYVSDEKIIEMPY